MLMQEKQKEACTDDIGFNEEGRAAKSGVRMRTHLIDHREQSAPQMSARGSEPHAGKAVCGAMIYKVRPKRQSSHSAKKTWLFLLGGRGSFFTGQRIIVNIC